MAFSWDYTGSFLPLHVLTCSLSDGNITRSMFLSHIFFCSSISPLAIVADDRREKDYQTKYTNGQQLRQ